jgi:hypothetical protein
VTETGVAARAVDVWKVYRSGEAQVVALRGVSVALERGRSPRSWDRPGPANRRRCTAWPGWIRCTVATCTSDYPLVTVGDQADLIAQTNSTVDIALAIVSVLLLVAILIAFLGILNTLLLSSYERTRDLGMLRAIGLSRRGVRRMVGVERC